MAKVELYSQGLFSDANLVAYYRLSDTSDSKGSYTLTNNNSVGFVSGLYGNCADFGTANTNKSLSVASNLGITKTTNFSVSLWFKSRSETAIGETDDDVFVLQNNDDGVIYIMYYSPGASMNMRRNIRGNGATDVTITSSGALGTTSWYHFAFTYDGTNIYGYKNGELFDSDTAPNGTKSGDTTTGLSIGAAVGNLEDWVSGYVDDVAVFSKCLTAQEVKFLYEYPSGSFLFNLT